MFDYGSCFVHNRPTKDESGIKHVIGVNNGDCVIFNSSTEQTNQTKSNRLEKGCNVGLRLRWDIFGYVALSRG